LPSKLNINIDDAQARDVQLWINKAEIGLGPKKDLAVAAGRVELEPVLAGKTCEAIPNRFTLGHGETRDVTVRCREAPAGRGGRAYAAQSAPSGSPEPSGFTGSGVSVGRRSSGGRAASSAVGSAATSASAPTPQPASGDCTAPPGLTGWVTINTKPYSEVYLDGKKLGETPLAKVKLPSGCWEIRAVAPDSKKEKKVRIEVQPNKNLRYQFDVP
jgi:hypothetical protein